MAVPYPDRGEWKQNLSKDTVKKAQGPANIIKAERSIRSGGSHSTTEHYFAYELHIGEKEFDVDESLANVMLQQDEYAVYYDDRNGKILVERNLWRKQNRALGG